MRRNPQLSLRKPEDVSIQHALGFNKGKVTRFFAVLHDTLSSADGSTFMIPLENIYKINESGFSICQKTQKIIAPKGKRTVGAITSAEKGKNITVVCCISATEMYISPMFIFPRVKISADYPMNYRMDQL